MDPPRPVAVLFLSAGALPGVALLAPLAVLVFQGLTPHLAVAAMAPAALLLALALPALLAAAGQRQRLALAALMACLAALAGPVWGGPDARRPRTADLVHLEDLDEGSRPLAEPRRAPAPLGRGTSGRRPGDLGGAFVPRLPGAAGLEGRRGGGRRRAGRRPSWSRTCAPTAAG